MEVFHSDSSNVSKGCLKNICGRTGYKKINILFVDYFDKFEFFRVSSSSR